MLCATALVGVALVGAGCKKSSPIVGKWNATQQGGTLDFEFKPDDTFTIAIKAGIINMTAKGDYKLNGDTLTLTMKDLDMPGLSPDMIAKAKSMPGSNFGKPQDLKVQFPSADELTLSGGSGAMGALASDASKNQGAKGGAVSLKRVKDAS